MASGSYRQVNVVCPYYIADDGRRVVICEGVIPDTRSRIVFRCRSGWDRHMTSYCESQYWMCEQCIALDDKYKEDL